MKILGVAARFSLVTMTVALAGCAADAEEPGQRADEVRATKTLLCASGSEALVYYGRTSQILLEADVARDGELRSASLTMPAARDLGARGEKLTAQRRYEPQNPRYAGHQKYTTADNWCGYAVIAPPNLNGQEGTFSVYVQQLCDGNFVSTETLRCKVESRRPGGEAPTTGATVELRYLGGRKADVIAAGYFEASDFTGDAVLVTGPETDVDLDTLVPEEDSESAPDAVCYRGDVAAAKKTLWAMLSNTDGNGDHWLDEGASITGRAGGALTVDYGVTGEGGPLGRTLTVSVCR